MRIDTILASASSGRLATLARSGIAAQVIVSEFDEESFTAALQNLSGSTAPLGSAGSVFTPAAVVSTLALGKALKVVFPQSDPQKILTTPAFIAALQQASSALPTAPGLSSLDLDLSLFLEPEFSPSPLNPRLEGAQAKLVIACDSMLLLNNQLVGKPHTPEKAWTQIRALRNASPTLYSGHVLCYLAPDSSARFALGISRSLVHFGDFSEAEIAAYIATGEPLQVAGGFTIDGLGGAFINGIEGDYHGIVGLSLPLARKLAASLGVSWQDLWNK